MKTFLKIISLFSLVLFSFSAAQAFNKDQCSKLFPTFDDDHPPYGAPIYVSTMLPSTTSYFSSIGPCAMYGRYGKSVARRFFIEDSLADIQIDVARGEGEHLQALALYSGCPAHAQSEFASEMRANYNTLFAAPNDSYNLGLRIDKVLSAGSLQKKCVTSPSAPLHL